ncbi:MAG: hypothetical protein N3A59_01560 [Thermodesulfovibrionales bacterium]|nr:hypothetical protein [Thermodesulfovibrionales bacterium]
MKYKSEFIVIATLLVLCVTFPSLLIAQGAVVEISPSSGIPETAIKISGKGFAPEEEIDILMTIDEGMKIGLGTEKVEIIQADATGTFTANSAIPRMAKPGQYKIEVIGNKGSQVVLFLEVIPKK